jgi:4a-hydroxytetrahydrobiopterin dehydratase
MKSVPKQLSQKQIEKKLSQISEWHLNKKLTEISKAFTFSSYVSGLAFVAKIAVHAELLGHHPTVELSYGRVVVTLTTHDTKGLSDKDFELAKRIDGLRVD